MAQPGLAGSQFPSEDALIRRLKDLERDVQQLRSANQLGAAGISAVDNGIIVGGSQTVNGPLEVNGDSTINGPLEVNGNSEFNWSLSINGPLNLQPGSIQNDALTNPVQFLAGVNDNEALYITLTDATICTYAFTVPAGFTQAFVIVYGSIGIVNPTGANASIGGRVYIDRPNGQGSTWGPRRFQQALAGADAATYPFKQTIVTGLSGGETITCRMTSMNAGATDWGNTVGGASLNVSAYFTR
jgi:hypothetical protein